MADAPDLPAHLRAYLRAYNELDTCRPLGFGAVGPIPWTAIDAYGARHGFWGEHFDDLVFAVRAMDTAALKLKKSLDASKEAASGGNSQPVLKSHGAHRGQRG